MKYVVSLLGALSLILLVRAQTNLPPALPAGPQVKTLIFKWQFPADQMVPVRFGLDKDGNAISVTNAPTVFYLYRSNDLTNWTSVAIVTNQTAISYQILPTANSFF